MSKQTKSTKTPISKRSLNIALVVAGCIFASVALLLSAPLYLYTTDGIIGLIMRRILVYAGVLGAVAVIVAAIRKDIRKHWFPAFAWLFILASVFSLATSCYVRFVVAPSVNSAIDGLTTVAQEPPKPVKKNAVDLSEDYYKRGEAYSKGKGVPQDSYEAIEWYSKAAKLGHSGAQYALGVALLGSEDVVDQAKAVDLLSKAADKDHARAQLSLGLCYMNGVGAGQSTKKARHYFGCSASNGCAEAQFRFANMLSVGQGGPTNKDKAIFWYVAAAVGGHTEAEYVCGMASAGGDTKEDYDCAFAYFTKAAEKGHVGAIYNVGVMLTRDKFGVRNYKSAFNMYEIAAEQGHAEAQFDLALLYNYGMGVEKDYELAFKWFEEAANQGHAIAQFFLGSMYDKGQGLPVDHYAAFQWYSKAARQGYLKAQYEIGVKFQFGLGVQKNILEAVKWYEKAALQGDAYAQCNLASIYYTGEGVPRDYSQAFRWYTEAAKKDNTTALVQLGWMYLKEQGIAGESDKCTQFWIKAAKLGDPEGRKLVGVLYDERKGVFDSHEDAFNCYREMAQQGDADAQRKLAFLYLGDRIGDRDYKLAVYWLSLAAGQDDCDAIFALGSWYQVGINGIAVNKKKALELYSKGAFLGHVYCQRNLGGMFSEEYSPVRNLGLAYVFYSLAAQSSDEVSIKQKALLKQKLTSLELMEAEKAFRTAWAKMQKAQ